MLRLPTYTSIWQVERRLYKIEDWALPAPVSLLQAGTFAAVGVCWWGLLSTLGVGFGAETGWAYLVPPALCAWAASRPVAEHKRPHELLRSQVVFLLSRRTWTGLRAARRPRRLRVDGRAWVPSRPPRRPWIDQAAARRRRRTGRQ